MRAAVTRPVSRSLARCELGYLQRQPVDVGRARQQHGRYVAALEALGVQVISLEPRQRLPDAVFVEDTAVVVDEIAVMTRPGAPSRRPEVASVARCLARYRTLAWIREPGTLDGGDVVQAGREVFAGCSARTNPDGMRQLARHLAPFGYAVRPVAIRDCLHMKSACSYLGRRTILANPAWVDTSPFRDYSILEVAPEEPWAANVLAIGEDVIVPGCFPATSRRLAAEGWRVHPVDVSELMKAEGGVTCMSIILET